MKTQQNLLRLRKMGDEDDLQDFQTYKPKPKQGYVRQEEELDKLWRETLEKKELLRRELEERKF